MTRQVTAAQIRAARALLDWSLVDLARAARVSVSSVKRLEDGALDEGGSAISSVGEALERAGIRFLSDDGDGPGVRLRVR